MAGSGMEGRCTLLLALVFLRFVNKKENRQCWTNVVCSTTSPSFSWDIFASKFSFVCIRGVIDALEPPFLLSQNTQTSVKSQLIQPPVHISKRARKNHKRPHITSTREAKAKKPNSSSSSKTPSLRQLQPNKKHNPHPSNRGRTVPSLYSSPLAS